MERPTLAEDISPREAEVLFLVREHLTNAEIGERLFISVRTVETHVASLLRKLHLADKRTLATYARTHSSASSAPASTPPALPISLTAFVGRAAERHALAALLKEQRLVTALGPGGVGKTRLTTAVAAEAADDFDGVWFVDLVPVTDPAMIPTAVTTALGIPELPGKTAAEAAVTWIGGQRLLVVLDNCEHLVDGAAIFAETVLSACPNLVLLATSRIRLMLPFEHVFTVEGLSVSDDCDSDALALFEERAAAVGATLTTQEERERAEAICRHLDGHALAIELAASRLPSLGLDGLEAGLAEPLRVLSGGSRATGRHASLTATFDWSWSLLDDEHRGLLDQVSVFHARFTAADAAAVATPARTPLATAEALARLADNSLLAACPDAGGTTRYRALEEVRQYGQERLGDSECSGLRQRHRTWCLATARELLERCQRDDPGWRHAFDAVAPDIRASLLDDRADRQEARELTSLLAELSFARGTPREAMRRYEQAAALTDAAKGRVHGLMVAAGAAYAASSGNDGHRLLLQAAREAQEHGDPATAARALARAAESAVRFPGIHPQPIPSREAFELLDQARAIGDTSPRVQAAIATAAACVDENQGLEAGQQALHLAKQTGRPLLVSAALDIITAYHLLENNVSAAAETVRERAKSLHQIGRDPQGAVELLDGFLMAADVLVGAGDLPDARRYADELAALPFISEDHYYTTSRQIRVCVWVGDIPEAVRLAERFRAAWERAGRPVIGQLSDSAHAAAAAHRLAGNQTSAREWDDIAIAIRSNVRADENNRLAAASIFAALAHAHSGEPADALAVLPDPDEGTSWHHGLWRPWRVALWVEASVLAHHPDATKRLKLAPAYVADNPIAATIVARSAALLAGDTDAVLATESAFDALGSPYQAARSLALGGKTEEAQKAFTALGVAWSE